jgi:hypothetical protein
MPTRMLYVLALTLCCGATLSAQRADWVNGIGDMSGNTVVRSIARYADDGVVIAGSFSGRNLTLGSVTLKNAGSDDAFVALFSNDGALLWAESFGGSGEDVATAVEVDPQGKIYLALAFKSLSVTIGERTLMNRGEGDALLIKFNENGEIAWIMHFDGYGDDEITALATDSRGDLYLVGHETIIQGPRDISAFAIKLDPLGASLWRHSCNGSNVRFTSVAVSDQGNCYIGASFYGTISFSTGQEFVNTEGLRGFIVQYNPYGEYVRTVMNPLFSAVNELKAHGEALYAAGEKRNYGMGWGWPLMDSRILLTKYNSTLDIIWERSAGGEKELQSLDIVNGMSCDEKGNVYLTGYFFSDTLSFAGDQLMNILNKEYYYQQIFILKYDSSGTEIWGKALGGSLNDEGGAIVALGEDSFFLAGYFESDELHIDAHRLVNTAPTREIYVHLRPPRYGRNAISFLSRFDAATSGIQRPYHPGLATLYPNPAGDVVLLCFPSMLPAHTVISLYSMDGRLLHTQQANAFMPLVAVHISGLAPGKYIVKLITGTDIEVHRFVKL